jgi:hypothetical protein
VDKQQSYKTFLNARDRGSFHGFLAKGLQSRGVLDGGRGASSFFPRSHRPC